MRYFNLLRNISNWWLYLAVKSGRSTADPLVFRTRSGVAVEVPRRLLQTFKEIFMSQSYLAELQRPLPPQPVIIDIGANAGFFTLLAASRCRQARLFAFEPVPANFKQLERNRALNPRCDIRCVPKAVAGQAGEIVLRFDPTDSFTTSATMLESTMPEGAPSASATLRVPCLGLGEVLDENQIARCDLLKLDCEGAEYDILYNCAPAALRRIAQLVMETHDGPEPQQNAAALEKFLRGAGFATRRAHGLLCAWRED